MDKLKKVVIISPDHIGKQMAGPGIRYWHFAKELSVHFNVVLFTPNYCEFEEQFRIKLINKSELKIELSDADSVILQGLTLWEFPFIKKTKAAIVIDLYDPFIFENLEMNYREREQLNNHFATLSVLIDQLRWGDYFICASEKQKDFWLGMLATMNRINPLEYQRDKTAASLIGIVPFGLESNTVPKNLRVMKGIVKGIELNDKVLLWGGGIWPWLDPLTAIQAMDLISKERTDVKLFFMGTKHPNPLIFSAEIVQEAINLSEKLNLRNKYVFFNDWVDYSQRHNYYLEADIGISLHHNHLETRFSFRTRMLDYIWCKLPIVCTEGDVLSEVVSNNGIGYVVPPQQPEILAQKILALLNDSNVQNENFNGLKDFYSWSNCIEPLIAFCQNPTASLGKQFSVKIPIMSKPRYYFSKVMHYASTGQIKFIISKAVSRIKK